MTKKTIASFKITIAVFKLALSRMPFTRTTVTSAAITIAGRSNQVPVNVRRPVDQIVIERRVREGVRQSDVEEGKKILKVMGPAVRNGGRGHRVLENQIPSDDPREQLAQGRVGVRVCRSRHGHHGRELRITQSRENARDSGHNEREHQCGPGKIVRRNPCQHEDACADDRSHPEARELDGTEHAMQTIFAAKLFEQRLVRLRQE